MRPLVWQLEKVVRHVKFDITESQQGGRHVIRFVPRLGIDGHDDAGRGKVGRIALDDNRRGGRRAPVTFGHVGPDLDDDLHGAQLTMW